MVPKALQAQAIAIAHEGHQQTDGTLRMLRENNGSATCKNLSRTT